MVISRTSNRYGLNILKSHGCFHASLFLNVVALCVIFAAYLPIGHTTGMITYSRTSRKPFPGFNGVSSLLKDFGCGFENMIVPSFLNSGDGQHRVMVDIGLNMGEETLAAAKSGFIVYAFEPVSNFVDHVIGRLESENILYYEVQLDVNTGQQLEPLPIPPLGRGMVYLFRAAAGSKFEKKTIAIEGPASSFVDKESIARGTLADVLVVPVSAYIDVDVYYLKVDSQGWESEVLEGLMDLLRKRVIRAVSVELWPRGLIEAESSADAVIRLLVQRLGYLCFDSRISSGIKPLHPESLDNFVEMVDQLHEGSKDNRFGFFDDLTCLSPNFASYKKSNTS